MVCPVHDVAGLQPGSTAAQGEAVGPLPTPALPAFQQLGWVVVPWKPAGKKRLHWNRALLKHAGVSGRLQALQQTWLALGQAMLCR